MTEPGLHDDGRREDAKPPAGRREDVKPPAARRWLESSLPREAPGRERIWVGQRGSMEAQGRWLTFTATGTYEARPLSYDWRARLRVMALMWVLAKDGHRDGEGWGGAWAYGIKSLGERRGADVLLTQLMRNLAELVWVPDLARDEPGLEWRDAGTDSFEIAYGTGTGRASVRFDVDDRGDVVRAFGMRPLDLPDGPPEALWRCDFSDPREFDGVRIPVNVEATYELDHGPWPYFRAEVTSIDRQTIRD